MMILMPIIFVFLGTVLLVIALHYLKLGKQTSSWMPKKANILQQGGIRSRGGAETATHKYYIKYEYEVKGTTYIGTRISFKPAIIPANKEKDKYSGLSKVLVYYDPQQPSQAVIEPGIDNSNFIACFVGLFFISVGVAYYLWS